MQRPLAICFGVVLTTCVSLYAQKPNDALKVDPDVHKLVLENDHIRVFEARASRGARSPMHSHPPFVFISLSTARVKLTLPDGKKAILDTYPGQVMWLPDGLEHSWELLSGEINVIAVEVKSAQRKSGPLSPVARKANDSVTVDPDVHHVLFENDHVRVFDGRATKGQRSPMHSHPPTLIVMMGKGRGKITTRDGSSFLLDYTPGQVLWADDGMEHSWEMVSGDPHVIAVEVKSAQRARAAKPPTE